MSEIKLTIKQVANNLGESVHVVRNWLKEFRAYIPCEKSEGGYNLFNQDAIDAITRIQKMFREQNLTGKQIEALLAGADRPVVRNEETAAAVETMEGVRELLEEQREFNQALLKGLDEQRKQFEIFVQKRDEQIMYVLRELQEAREQKKLMGGQQQNDPWWKRWFKG